MSGNKKPHPLKSQQANPQQAGAVFPGKTHANHPAVQSNLALKQSLGEIFDEFTVVISGELKSMNLEQFEAEHPQRPL
ncbi:hypothetical protein [Vampirovibrio sp.]|uniref:hypothetical protein n=1 Tax=Vampirovibrio sp. TaxID=2717857 RepID=UPI00359491F7